MPRLKKIKLLTLHMNECLIPRLRESFSSFLDYNGYSEYVLEYTVLDYVTIKQSIEIYIAPLQDPYSEALPTQAKRKRTVLRRWWN